MKDNSLLELWKENVFIDTVKSGIPINPIGNLNFFFISLLDNDEIDTRFYIDAVPKTNNIDSLPKSRIDSLKHILSLEELNKNQKDFLFNNLIFLKRIYNRTPLVRIYEYSICKKKFKLFVIRSLLLGQMAITLFIGIFIHLIIQRKPLSG